ncbi:hypothetical protein TTHERM_00617810 (macronuclear) [Tetrahymena thermophila SB210]|uniref:Tetratricopeptide repeat protein n=1 Tax=Tetrahymena thermophila (strain SB210) TaxID=312017 RepID=Q23MI1_TETTS|nr:hypothetical protein TTHERM_00617810 [Tetrahymena thermophila SB210]EAR97658.2 hypothetical protein TTHERM_00617810 [Tetrahymena thermophila SB210]|eukprot:XP_001017903.2 hypothetical protein TTHERM_00617810 [Tetrahymena thermophila SB210]
MKLFKQLTSSTCRYLKFSRYCIANSSPLYSNQIKFKFSSTDAVVSQKQLEELRNYKLTNKIDSETLMKRFQDNIEKIDNSDLVNQFCVYFIQQFENRIETQKAIQICDYAIDRQQKNYSPTTLMYFMGQKILLKYEQGDLNDMNKLADQLYALYLFSREILDSTTRIKYQSYLAETMAKVNLVEHAERYLNGTVDSLQNDERIDLSWGEVYDLYYIHFGCYFLQQKYEQALHYGLVAYQMMKGNPFVSPSFILLGIYQCLKFINNELGQQQVLLELLKYPQDGINLSNIDKLVFVPFKKKQKNLASSNLLLTHQKSDDIEKVQQKQFRDQILYDFNYANFPLVNILKQKISKQSDTIWNEKDDKGRFFIEQNKIDKGIEYYKDILTKLDSIRDQEKIIQVSDRLAYLYSKIDEFDKALELSLEAHQRILKLRNNILMKDNMTLQNILYIKFFYHSKNDYAKSVEWGKKWHAYCIQYNIFDIYDDFIVENLFSQASSLILLNQQEEALEYCKFIQEYLEKFNNEDMLRALHGMLFNIYSDINNLPEALKNGQVVIDYYNKNLKILTQREKNLLYQSVLKCCRFAQELQDEQNIYKYGRLYLQLRKDEETEFENIEFRIKLQHQIILVMISKRQYKDAKQMINQVLDLINQNPNMQNYLIKILLAESQMSQKQLKYQEAEKCIQQAEEILENISNGGEMDLENDQNLYENLKLEVYLNKSLIHYNKNEFNQSIKYIEKYVQIYKKLRYRINSKVVEILKTLYKKQEYKNTIRELILTNNISFDSS